MPMPRKFVDTLALICAHSSGSARRPAHTTWKLVSMYLPE